MWYFAEQTLALAQREQKQQPFPVLLPLPSPPRPLSSIVVSCLFQLYNSFYFFILLLIPLRSSRHLNRLVHAVRLGRVNLLARLGNLGQDRLVREPGDDLGGLVLEGDFVALDACGG